MLTIGGIAVPYFGDIKIAYTMAGMGTSGMVTSTMELKSYCPTVVGEDLWGNGAEVQLVCASDSSIVIPTFYVKSRNVDGNFASWVCADGMSKTDVIVEFADNDFKDGKISARAVLTTACEAAGFSGHRYTSSAAAGFIDKIDDIKRESAEGKTARDIINSFAAAFCSYVIEGDDNEIIFVPFGTYYRVAGAAEIKHTPFKYRGKKRYTKLIMYSGDKTLVSYNDDDFVRKLYKDFNIQAVSRQNNLSTGQFKEVMIKNY